MRGLSIVVQYNHKVGDPRNVDKCSADSMLIAMNAVLLLDDLV
jgi:hypothetical protein